jgi:MraZ protein
MLIIMRRFLSAEAGPPVRATRATGCCKRQAPFAATDTHIASMLSSFSNQHSRWHFNEKPLDNSYPPLDNSNKPSIVSKSGKKWVEVVKSGINMFRGIYAINLDDKGRMAVPSRFRTQLDTSGDVRLVLTIDAESPCLLLYPFVEWELIEQKLQALPSFNQVTRRIQRLLIGHATEIEPDSHGRILLPPLLREHANLTKRITLIGQGRKFELWDEQIWQTHRERWLKDSLVLGSVPTELEAISL